MFIPMGLGKCMGMGMNKDWGLQGSDARGVVRWFQSLGLVGL